MTEGEPRMPITIAAWRRLKLNIAEWLVLSIPLSHHDYNDDLIKAADAIRDFRQRYYNGEIKP